MALARDARLADRVRRDDDAAFERLHARYQPEILAFCRHLTGSREDAEDAVQHTFLAAYRRIADSEGTRDWRPWLFTVARNRCLTLLRARREPALAEPDVATSFDGLAIEVERRQELRDLVRDMARLPEPQRAALVLSQFDALSYGEIGTVLGVTPEKVKALVFQARSSLTSMREARDEPCLEIRREIATARGPALRRRLLRRHVGQCEGCRDFEVAVLRQRDDLGVLLPVAPSAGLGQAVLGAALGREGGAAASAGGAAVASGGTGAGLAGTLAALGAGGALKLAVVVAIAGSSTAGALAADLPAKVGHAAPWRTAADDGGASRGGAGLAPDRPAGGLGAPGDPARPPAPGERQQTAGGHGESAPGPPEVRESGAAGDDSGRASASGGGPDAGGGQVANGGASGGLPPGLAKKDELPPGLAKRDELPPGLAKRDGAAPGQSGKAPKEPPSGGGPARGNGGGAGNGGGGQGQGTPVSGGVGSGNQGNGVANGGGNGNGNGGSSGGGNQGNAGGQGNGTGKGNGGGNPH